MSIHFGYQLFIIYVLCKDFLPVSDLHFHSFKSVLYKAEVLNFNEAQFLTAFANLAQRSNMDGDIF